MNKIQENMIMENENLIHQVLKEYTGFLSSSTVFSYDDLFQTGRLGLCKAVMTFDVKRNVEFSTYAFVVIRNEIRQSIQYEIKSNKYAYVPFGDDLESDEEKLHRKDRGDPIPSFVATFDSGIAACELSEVNKLIAEISSNAKISIKIGIAAIIGQNSGEKLSDMALRYGITDGTLKRYMFNAKQYLRKNKALRALWEEC